MARKWVEVSNQRPLRVMVDLLVLVVYHKCMTLKRREGVAKVISLRMTPAAEAVALSIPNGLRSKVISELLTEWAEMGGIETLVAIAEEQLKSQS